MRTYSQILVLIGCALAMGCTSELLDTLEAKYGEDIDDVMASLDPSDRDNAEQTDDAQDRPEEDEAAAVDDGHILEDPEDEDSADDDDEERDSREMDDDFSDGHDGHDGGEHHEDEDDENREEEHEDERDEAIDRPTDPSTAQTSRIPQDGRTLRIQTIGDSHLAFNGRRSTADQLRDVLRERGYEVELRNNAVGGATLGCGEDGLGNADNCIPPQFEEGDWTHIVVTGGGNDFLESQCGVEVDRLMTSDGTSGRMVDVIENLLDASPEVILVGYVDPLEPDGEAGACTPLQTLMARYETYASQVDGVTFIDTRSVFNRSQPEMYADDVHTSALGSRTLAEAIADTLQ